MRDNLFKIPMEPRHFETWIAAPLRESSKKLYQVFSATGSRDGMSLALTAYFLDLNDPEGGAVIVFTSTPPAKANEDDSGNSSTGKSGGRCIYKVYPAEEAFEAVYAIFENLFVNSIPPSDRGWRKRDDRLGRIEEGYRLSRIFSDLELGLELKSSRDEKSPLEALKALHAKDPVLLDQIVASDLDDDNFYVPKNEEEETDVTVPLLARYFAEVENLSFSVEAIKTLASRHVRPIGDSWDGPEVFRPLLRHYEAPEFLDVWKALLEVEQPFVQAPGKSRIDAYDVKKACWEAYGNKELREQNGNPEKLFLTVPMTDRLEAGIPFDGISDLPPIIGKKLSRVLFAPSPEYKTPKLEENQNHPDTIDLNGCVILDFEGVFMVAADGHPGCADTAALAAFPNAKDASEQFSVPIGKRVISSEFTIRKAYHNTHSLNQTLVFEDGTFLFSEGWLDGNKFRCFKRNWGSFSVKSGGILERMMFDDCQLEDVYGNDLWFIQNVEDLFEAANRNPVLNAYLDGAFSQWWAEHRKKRIFTRTWREAVSEPTDQKAEEIVWDIVRRWLDKDAPHEGPERAVLPNGFSTDRGLAAHELEDMPEVFAKELGLVWPNPEDHCAVENYEEGIRLTKPIEEANAIAKAHGWWISFEENSVSLRGASLR